jgi:ZIP family zinc transporter
MDLQLEALRGILLPFVGTALGAAWVLFLGRRPGVGLERVLGGFAAGVMVAASVWSLLLPAIEQSVFLGCWAFLPAASGFWVGVLFLLVLDELVPHLNLEGGPPEGVHTPLKRTTMLALAVTLHNVPEGMAVGVVYAALLQGSPGVTAAGALALAAGIAIQNVPEGAIISLPLGAEGMGKGKACLWGVLSGAVEPAAAAMTLLAAAWVGPVMPCLLSFAAGAMFYVVVEDLVPEMAAGEHSNLATLTFALGFTLMLALDVAFG